MKVLVCGGRDWSNRAAVWFELDRLHPTMIIEGGARGADADARLWAERNGIPHMTMAAQWTTYGRKAGPIRNQRMLDELKPDLVLAFPGGRGTADMVGRALRAGIKIVHYLPYGGGKNA